MPFNTEKIFFLPLQQCCCRLKNFFYLMIFFLHSQNQTRKMKALLFLTAALLTLNLSAQNYSRVKIYTDQEGITNLLNKGVAVDHGIRKEGIFIISELSQKDIQQLSALNYQYEILIDDVSTFYVQQNKNADNSTKNTLCTDNSPIPGGNVIPSNFHVPSTYGGFFKYNEMLQELDNMAALYPNLISVKAPISNFLTWENRPIYQVKISNNPNTDDGDPMALYSAVHHAREPLGMSEVIYYMWYLLENYATNPEVKFLVDNTQMIFVPCLNPDGYIFNETTDPNGGGMHRKNRNPSVGSSNGGVDLNRNYGYQWGTSGVSFDVNDDTYPGTSAFSEPETQAMRWLVQNLPIRSALNAHTYSNLLLFPIGTSTSAFANHHAYFQALANYLVQYNGFVAQKSSALYPASGDSDDYMYMSDNGVLQKDTVFAMTPEIGSSFWPATSEIIPLCQGMLFPNLGMSHMLHKYYIVEEDDPSNVIALTGDFHHTVQKLGREAGSALVSIEPLQNITAVGAPITYNLAILGTGDGNISFALDNAIQTGDSIIYVLSTDDGDWIKRDTIVKIYGGDYDTLAFETGDDLSNWTGGWSTSGTIFYSPSKSITDSPGYYPNNVNRTTTYTPVIDLTSSTAAHVSFFARWDIEKDYDYCQFQVSTDGGTNWIAQCGLFTQNSSNQNGTIQPQNQPLWDGARTTWVEEKIDLSDYIGQSIKVRFILKSDGGVRKDGFYFDDFRILSIIDTVSTAGIANLTNSVVSIYPNPSNGELTIKNAAVNDNVTVYDIRGLLVFSSKITEMNETKIDLSSLSNGSYFVKISGESTNAIQQLIIKK